MAQQQVAVDEVAGQGAYVAAAENERAGREVVVFGRPDSRNKGSSWLWKLGLAGAGILSFASGKFFSPGTSIDPTDYAARTRDVLSRTPLIDGHNDLPYLIRNELRHEIYSDRFTFRTGLLSNTDQKKLKEGMVGGQFWSAYIHCPDPSKKIELDDATV